MMVRINLVFVLLSSVTGQRFHPEESPRHRIIDIFDDDRHDIDYQYYRRPFMLETFHDSSEENFDTDRIEFHYPHVQFFTKNYDRNEDFVPSSSSAFSQSQPALYNDGYVKRKKKKSRLVIKPSNQTIFEPVALSFVQKIPKPSLIPDVDTSEYTKYEESTTGSMENSPDDKTVVKEKIHSLLNKYLTNLYDRKFNSTNEITPGDGEVDAKTSYSKDKSLLWSLKNKTINKINRLFSLFTILQFNNTQCNATNSTGSYLGICYTATECTNLDGTAVGSCATGYGVCCVFGGTCGGSAQQNCSYFQSPNYPDYYPAGGSVIVPTTMRPPATTAANPSPTPDPRLPHWFGFQYRSDDDDDALSCTFSVYKVDDNVTRMRIDFLDLELTSPTNGTCTTERLVISGQNTNDIIPTICGYNTGQHMYVDVSQVSGPLQLMVISDGAYRKKFRIRVCQYADNCSSPMGNCLQYYTGVTGNISSFNYDQASMFNRSVPGYFNDLNYAICIRKAAGYCTITYTNVRNGVEYPFELPNVDSDGIVTVPRGMAGIDSIDCPNDFIVIANTRLCGYKFNDGTVNSNLTMNAAVTDSNAGPIVVPVRTNSAVTGLGFKLFYTQNRCPS